MGTRGCAAGGAPIRAGEVVPGLGQSRGRAARGHSRPAVTAPAPAEARAHPNPGTAGAGLLSNTTILQQHPVPSAASLPPPAQAQLPPGPLGFSLLGKLQAGNCSRAGTVCGVWELGDQQELLGVWVLELSLGWARPDFSGKKWNKPRQHLESFVPFVRDNELHSRVH